MPASPTLPRHAAWAVGRSFALGLLAIAGVVSSGVWLGHRLDPTWGRGSAGLRRAIPFPLPPTRAAQAPGRRPWILELRFPGCGADDADVSGRVSALAGRVRARGGGELGWLTLLVGGLPDQASGSLGPRRIAPLAPGALADIAAQLGLAGSARAAADGLLDARHWLFAVDAGGWVRGAVELTGGRGWPSFEDAVLTAARTPLAPPPNPDAPLAATPVRLVPFQAVDQNGRVVTERDFAGHPVVIDFIFTRCTGPCPMMTARLAALRRMVSDPKARFLSFSVDPAHDTPAVLRAYATRWGTPDARWRLLAADAATVQAVARGLGELVAERADGLLLHSEHFTLLDGAGRVRARVPGPEIKTLAAQLSAPPASAGITGEGLAGARLFASLGCAGCHGHSALGPPLGGLAGRRVHLADGRTVAADDRYLRASITSPLDAVVDGFRPSMPSYGGLLSDSELTTLVDYLKSLRD